MLTTIQTLMEQREALDAQINVEKAAIFHTTMQHAVYLFSKAGVALDEAAADLLTRHNKSASPQRAKVAPKYRHRATGATWTGRGKQPKWFAEAEQSEIEHLGGDLT